MPKANRPDSLTRLLGSRVRAEVLKHLFGPGAQPSHLRALQRKSGLNVSTVRRELGNLIQLGLVQAVRDGNRVVYSANKSHPISPELGMIVEKTVGAIALIREALMLKSVHWALIFGSVASGTERSHSDIDLVVIGDIGLRRTTAALAGIAEIHGREINPVVMTEAEFFDRLARKDQFLRRVLPEPRIMIAGDENEFAGLVEKRMAASSRRLN